MPTRGRPSHAHAPPLPPAAQCGAPRAREIGAIRCGETRKTENATRKSADNIRTHASSRGVGQPGLRGCQAQDQGSPAHAATRLRLPPGERGTGYAIASSLPGAQEHPAYGPLHRADSGTIQGVVERLRTETASARAPRRIRAREAKEGRNP